MPFEGGGGGGGGSGGGVSTVTDGSTTVTSAVEIQFTSGAVVTNGGGGNAQVAIAATAAQLVPTAVKTANYNAVVGDLVLCDTTGGNFTVTFPSAPADGSLIGVKVYNTTGTNAPTLARSGSDVFDRTQTSIIMPAQSFACWIFQYQHSSGIWFSDSGRPGWIATVAATDTSIVVANGSSTPGIRTNTLDVIAAQHPAAADWSNNSHKITSLANGSGAQDAAAFGQIPTALPTTQSLDQIAVANATAANVSFNSHKATGVLGIISTVTTVTQSATPTMNTDNISWASITALAQAITSMTTNLSGTPAAGQSLIIEITDNGTARAITWGASFESSTVTLPSTTVVSTKLTVGFFWNAATSAWRCVAVA